jgi:uncharacterized protein (DUF885 family)
MTLHALPCAVLAFALACALSAGCASTGPREASPWTEAAGSVREPELAALCRDAWEWGLRTDPIGATWLGDPRYHGQLVLPSPAERERRRGTLEGFARRAAAIDAARLAGEDRTALELLQEAWRGELEELALEIDFDSWNLDPSGGPQNTFLTLAQNQPVETAREREQLLDRWRRIPAYVDQCAANLERGLTHGRVASRTAVTRVLAQLDHLLGTPPEESPLVAGVLSRIGREERPPRFAERLLATVREWIYPAFARYRSLLAEHVLPRTRDDDQPGLAFVAGGERAYEVAIRRHTSLALFPREIHDYGLAEVARIRSEIEELGERALGTRELPEIQRRLRTDPALHFSTRAEIEAKARDSLARAEAAVPSAFARLPRAPCEVLPVPEHEERDTTIAYYREPAPDGSRPGRYYVNTSEPATRPRYDAEVLAWHEAVPGHHLQIALAQELEGLPLVRRHQGSTAFVEGWALYTERLAEELGLYTGDLDRLGMLSFDAWRASRLVVDTGLHAFGWTRAQAIDFMARNTLLAENNVVNEVDRYIAWPGQALAYKLGQREILALRAEARERMGGDFSLPEFHERLLGGGAVTLSVLRRRIESWIGEHGRAAPTAEARP